MVVLQFAFGGGNNNVHLPHMHYENSFCYPGTHDNETAVGWWKDSANARDRAYLRAYLGVEGADIAWDFIAAAMASVSHTCVFMMQVRRARAARGAGGAAGCCARRRMHARCVCAHACVCTCCAVRLPTHMHHAPHGTPRRTCCGWTTARA